jgi:citrate lyase beta subunit
VRHVRLGASLYVPATRADLAEIGNGEKFRSLRSVIFCTEDAIRERDVDSALDKLERAFSELRPRDALRFVRARSPRVLARLLAMRHVERLDGFVLPKVTRHNVREYFELLPRDPAFEVMITLETREAFDMLEMQALRDLLLKEGMAERILAVRIGGNDLLNLLGIRRDPDFTVYETPLRQVIGQLAMIFRPYGFNLTGPVNECLNNAAVLAAEVALDLQHGLLGKTAIHPSQVEAIESHYRVSPEDLDLAESILDEDAPAVFRKRDRMCEPMTHRRWAEIIVERAQVFGLAKEPLRRVASGAE